MCVSVSSRIVLSRGGRRFAESWLGRSAAPSVQVGAEEGLGRHPHGVREELRDLGRVVADLDGLAGGGVAAQEAAAGAEVADEAPGLAVAALDREGGLAGGALAEERGDVVGAGVQDGAHEPDEVGIAGDEGVQAGAERKSGGGREPRDVLDGELGEKHRGWGERGALGTGDASTGKPRGHGVIASAGPRRPVGRARRRSGPAPRREGSTRGGGTGGGAEPDGGGCGADGRGRERFGAGGLEAVAGPEPPGRARLAERRQGSAGCSRLCWPDPLRVGQRA